MATRSPAKACLPVPAPSEHGDLIEACEHIVAIRGDVGMSLVVLIAALPQQKSAGNVPSVLRGMSQVFSEGSTQKLAEDEVVASRRPVEDGRTVELNDGLQEPGAADGGVGNK